MMTWSFKDQAKAIEHVKQAVAKGEFPMADLNEKVARILAVKKYLQEKTPQLGGIKSPSVIALSTKKLREIESRILDFNIKVAMQKSKANDSSRAPAAIPDKSISSKKPICVFSPMTEFIDSFKKANLPMTAIKTTAKTRPQSLVSTMTKASCSYGVYAVYGPKTATVLEHLPKNLAKKFLVVNLNTPSLIPDSEKFLNVVNLYFPHPEAGKKVADNLRALARRGPLGDVANIE